MYRNSAENICLNFESVRDKHAAVFESKPQGELLASRNR